MNHGESTSDPSGGARLNLDLCFVLVNKHTSGEMFVAAVILLSLLSRRVLSRGGK